MPVYKSRKYSLWGKKWEYENVDTGIYILNCQSDSEIKKYYVGKSTDLMRRMIQHKYEKDVKWLKKYPPIDIFYIHLFPRSELLYWEKKYFLAMAWSKGVANVRGSSWCKVDWCVGEREIDHINFYMKHYGSVPKHHQY